MKTTISKPMKEELIIQAGYEKIIGYAMDYEAPESTNIIVSLEEVRNWLGKPAEEFWIDKDGEIARDFEDTWETVTEDICDENNIEDSEDEEAIYQAGIRKVLNAK